MSINFTDEEMREIDEFVKQIDITNTTLVFNYGEYYQSQLAKKVEELSQRSGKVDTKHIHSTINRITQVIDSFSEYKSSRPNPISLRMRFKKDMQTIHELKNDLSSQSLTLDDCNDTFADCYTEIDKLYIIITKYIIAGDKKLEIVERDILPKLKEQSSDSFASGEEYAGMIICVKFFKDRLTSLRISQTNAIQLKQSISMQQDSYTRLQKLVNSILNNTIPAFEHCLML